MISPGHVLITGATGGLGRALALAYASPGVRLALTGRDHGRLAELVGLCRAAGADAHGRCLDITDRASVLDWLVSVDRDHPVDLAITCAGVSSSVAPDGSAEHPDDVRRLFAVNLMGSVEVIQPLAEAMRQRGHGQLALVSSLAALAPLPCGPAYCGGKSALYAYGLSLRHWLAPYHVGVSVVLPGFVDSPMSRRFQGARPFRWSAAKAAAHIRRVLARNRPVIAFPWPLALALKALRLLPHGVQGVLLRRLFPFTVVPDQDSPLSEKPGKAE